jgi:hypothetical protein
MPSFKDEHVLVSYDSYDIKKIPLPQAASLQHIDH